MNEGNNKKSLTDYTQEELSKLSPDQVQQMFMETLKEIVEVSQSAAQHISQLDEYRKKAEQAGDSQTANELGLVVDSAKNHLAEGMVSCQEIVEEIKKEDAKTLSMFSKASDERGKALTESLSSGARAHDEYLQARRDERYEQMIEEAGEIESPANRLRH
ncbi:hypothetical protein [Eubacterium sp.]|uniref:hypothetical protein n=1 Tax=Eubacterium sp. TaxID=142586 RepID=UPI0025F67367|nr:hypothetical protein [Eubacterium sp.]MCR5629713.1 hypothetical protein [Eubacterium sp.]